MHYNLVATGTLDQTVLDRVTRNLSVQDALLATHSRRVAEGLV